METIGATSVNLGAISVMGQTGAADTSHAPNKGCRSGVWSRLTNRPMCWPTDTNDHPRIHRAGDGWRLLPAQVPKPAARDGGAIQRRQSVAARRPAFAT